MLTAIKKLSADKGKSCLLIQSREDLKKTYPSRGDFMSKSNLELQRNQQQANDDSYTSSIPSEIITPTLSSSPSSDSDVSITTEEHKLDVKRTPEEQFEINKEFLYEYSVLENMKPQAFFQYKISRSMFLLMQGATLNLHFPSGASPFYLATKGTALESFDATDTGTMVYHMFLFLLCLSSEQMLIFLIEKVQLLCMVPHLVEKLITLKRCCGMGLKYDLTMLV